jgi:hypothetical protein
MFRAALCGAVSYPFSIGVGAVKLCGFVVVPGGRSVELSSICRGCSNAFSK